MAFCLAELHLWSTKSSLQVKDTDIGTYQYYDKGEPGSSLEHHYYNEKLHFCEARGNSWTPRNRRPEKLRDSLKELEELLQTNSCVHTRWRNKNCCQVMLSSGVLVTLTLSGPQLDRVCIDRTLVGRLPATTVTDAVLSDRLILLSFLEQSQVAAVYLNKKNQDSPETGRRTDKLSPSEIKVECVEVGGRGRSIRRHVGLNRLQDVALCWWDPGERGEGPWQWSPTDTSRNNLVLISCSPTEGLKVLGSVRTEGGPLDCRFSQLQQHQILTVELPLGPRGSGPGSYADSGVYECARGRVHRLSGARISLPSAAISCSRHPSETKLLLGLGDSSLVLHDQRRGVSLLAPSPVPPTLLAWHPAGAVAMVAGGQQELACFDVGLAAVRVALVAEEAAPAAALSLAQHLRCSGGVAGIKWGAGPDGGPEGTDLLILVFNGGPLAALKFKLGALTGGRLGPGELLQERLRCGEVREALGLLEALDWSSMGDECYRGLISISDHLLRLQLNAEREAQLEAALGVFYAPPAPLPDAVILEYREPISKYARRFFHHLLRHQRLEKAFLLAVDLEDRDLFMDLHYVASDKGEVVLADVAKRKANEIEAEAIAGNEQPLVGRKTPAERAQSTTHPDNIPTRSDGRANQRRPQAEARCFTISPDVLRTLKQTGRAAADGGRGDDGEDPGMLHVVHLGVV
ncbi:WD repeat-containing and planar cell polarity effector protein fritz homolog [Menidia menidia]